MITSVFRTVVFGFVTSEGKSLQKTSNEKDPQDKTPLLPKTFSEQMKEVFI